MTLQKPERVAEEIETLIDLAIDFRDLYAKFYPNGYQSKVYGLRERTSGGGGHSDPTFTALEDGQATRDALYAGLTHLRKAKEHLLGGFRRVGELSPRGDSDHMRLDLAGEHVQGWSADGEHSGEFAERVAAQARRQERGEE